MCYWMTHVSYFCSFSAVELLLSDTVVVSTRQSWANDDDDDDDNEPWTESEHLKKDAPMKSEIWSIHLTTFSRWLLELY